MPGGCVNVSALKMLARAYQHPAQKNRRPVWQLAAERGVRGPDISGWESGACLRGGEGFQLPGTDLAGELKIIGALGST